MIEWTPIREFKLHLSVDSFLILVEDGCGGKTAHTADYRLLIEHMPDKLIYVKDSLYFSPIFPYKQYPNRYYQGFKKPLVCTLTTIF